MDGNGVVKLTERQRAIIEPHILRLGQLRKQSVTLQQAIELTEQVVFSLLELAHPGWTPRHTYLHSEGVIHQPPEAPVS